MFTLGSQQQWLWHDDDNDMNNAGDSYDDNNDNIADSGKVSGKDKYDYHFYFMTVIWWKSYVRLERQ